MKRIQYMLEETQQTKTKMNYLSVYSFAENLTYAFSFPHDLGCIFNLSNEIPFVTNVLLTYKIKFVFLKWQFQTLLMFSVHSR